MSQLSPEVFAPPGQAVQSQSEDKDIHHVTVNSESPPPDGFDPDFIEELVGNYIPTMTDQGERVKRAFKFGEILNIL